MRVLVPAGDQRGLARFVQASTTTERFVAQETMKPNPLVCTAKPKPLFQRSLVRGGEEADGLQHQPVLNRCQLRLETADDVQAG